ncbi:MAG: DUF4126 domain-containing protein [Microcystaceae cyanobacterium]
MGSIVDTLVSLDTFISVLLGLSLSAACGFRVFIPFLIISIAAVENWIALPGDLSWLDTNQAIILLAVASLVEVVAYYVPWLDNALDTIALPLATAAGTWVTQSSLPEMNSLAQWTIALTAGGGTAGMTKFLNSLLRLGSTGTTGGLANPIFSTIELVSASAIAISSLFLPIATGFIVLILLIWGFFKIGIGMGWSKPKQPSRES